MYIIISLCRLLVTDHNTVIHLGTGVSLGDVVVQEVVASHALLLHQVVQEDLHGVVLAVVQEDVRIVGGLG